EPIELLQPCAIAEMESGDRVERQAAAVARTRIIPRGGADERFANSFGDIGRTPPAFSVERRQGFAIVVVEDSRAGIGAFALEPFGEIWRRRQRHERAEARYPAGNLLDH